MLEKYLLIWDLLATEHAPCPTCEARPGQRCRRLDKNHRQHRARARAATLLFGSRVKFAVRRAAFDGNTDALNTAAGVAQQLSIEGYAIEDAGRRLRRESRWLSAALKVSAAAS